MALPELDWENFDKPKGNGNGSGVSFLRWEEGATYRLRPLGSAIQYYKFFIEKGKPSFIVAPENKDAAIKALSEKTGKEIKPRFFCAMFVIDRADGKVKVLEGGFQIFDAFAKWSTGMGIRPGHGQAGDWQISVTGRGVGGSNPRKYTAVFLGNVAFTDEERSMVQGLKNDGKLKLANFLHENTVSELMEKAFGEEVSSAPSSSGDIDW